MSFIGDLKLDARGNSMVSGGELSVTDSNLEFVIRSLRYGTDSFKLNPEIGFGLDRYIGEENNEILRQKIVMELKDYFELYGITVDVHVMLTGSNTIGIEINFLLEDINIVFLFNIESGILTFDNDVPVEEEEILARRSDNKYLNRF